MRLFESQIFRRIHELPLMVPLRTYRPADSSLASGACRPSLNVLIFKRWLGVTRTRGGLIYVYGEGAKGGGLPSDGTK